MPGRFCGQKRSPEEFWRWWKIGRRLGVRVKKKRPDKTAGKPDVRDREALFAISADYRHRWRDLSGRFKKRDFNGKDSLKSGGRLLYFFNAILLFGLKGSANGILWATGVLRAYCNLLGSAGVLAGMVLAIADAAIDFFVAIGCWIVSFLVVHFILPAFFIFVRLCCTWYGPNRLKRRFYKKQ